MIKNKTIYLYNEGGRYYGQQEDKQIGRVEFIDNMGDDKRVVNAARVSFGKDNNLPFDEKDKKLIKYLLINNHTSPFENCFITWKFVVPLFIRSQHMRHRTFSFNEISRRYTSENIQFYFPHKFRSQHEKNKQASKNDEIDPFVKFYALDSEPKLLASECLTQTCSNLLELYNNMLEAGICREQARMTLPQNMYTEYYGSVNLHNVLRFLSLRLDEHSQVEIRVVAQAMKEHLTQLYPSTMEVFLKSLQIRRKFQAIERMYIDAESDKSFKEILQDYIDFK